jgi:hypothetical protein
MLMSRISWRSDGERPMIRRLISALGAILAVVAVGLAPAGLAATPVPQEQAGAQMAGCAPDRPAIPHHAGGVPADAP